MRASSIDLFEVQGPEDLLSEIQKAICEYHDEPNSRLFLFLVFALNHLREWIADSSLESIKTSMRKGIALSAADKFCWDLWDLQEFRIVNSLCNRSKHDVVSPGSKTGITRGFTCNSPCSDSLDQKYYWVDGTDSRVIFAAVLRRYLEWFAGHEK